jgi:hypothetical protein
VVDKVYPIKRKHLFQFKSQMKKQMSNSKDLFEAAEFNLADAGNNRAARNATAKHNVVLIDRLTNEKIVYYLTLVVLALLACCLLANGAAVLLKLKLMGLDPNTVTVMPMQTKE